MLPCHYLFCCESGLWHKEFPGSVANHCLCEISRLIYSWVINSSQNTHAHQLTTGLFTDQVPVLHPVHRMHSNTHKVVTTNRHSLLSDWYISEFIAIISGAEPFCQDSEIKFWFDGVSRVGSWEFAVVKQPEL